METTTKKKELEHDCHLSPEDSCDCQEEVCEFCLGEGTVSTDESDGEGHIMRGVGTEKCICQIRDEDESDQDR